MEVKLEDKGQDFLTLKIDKDGVINGYSPMFSNGLVSLVGIGTLDGTSYWTRNEVLAGKLRQRDGLYVYIKKTDEPDPLPWEASTLKYMVDSVATPPIKGKE